MDSLIDSTLIRSSCTDTQQPELFEIYTVNKRRYINTLPFLFYVIACDLEKSFRVEMTVKITSHILFPTYVQLIYAVFLEVW